ncbi:10431_t:CDS:1, partial [Gigaspora margarita]
PPTMNLILKEKALEYQKKIENNSNNLYMTQMMIVASIAIQTMKSYLEKKKVNEYGNKIATCRFK